MKTAVIPWILGLLLSLAACSKPPVNPAQDSVILNDGSSEILSSEDPLDAEYPGEAGDPAEEPIWTEQDPNENHNPPDSTSKITLGVGGVLQKDFEWTGTNGISIRLPAGTSILTSEGTDPGSNVELVTQPVVSTKPKIEGMTILNGVKVSVRVNGVEQPVWFFAHPDQKREPKLRFPVQASLPKGKSSSMYGFLDEVSPNKPLIPVNWIYLAQALAEELGSEVRLSSTGEYLQGHFPDNLPSSSNPLPYQQVWELLATSPDPIWLVLIVEAETAQVLASYRFDPGEIGPYFDGPPTRRTWMWLEPHGQGHTLHVRWNFGNRPIIRAASYQSSYQDLTVRGPFKVLNNQAQETQPLEKPYFDTAEMYNGVLHIRATSRYGGFTAFLNDVVRPLRAQCEPPDTVNYQNLLWVGVDWFRVSAQGGYQAEVRAVTQHSGWGFVRPGKNPAFHMPKATDIELRGRRLFMTIEKTWTSPQGRTWYIHEVGSDLTRDAAKTFCKNITEGGHNDWRLPTISELRTLYQYCPNLEPGGECKVTDSCLSYHDCYSSYGPCVKPECKGGPSGPFVVDPMYLTFYHQTTWLTVWSSSIPTRPGDKENPVVPWEGRAYIAVFGGKIKVDIEETVRQALALCVR